MRTGDLSKQFGVPGHTLRKLAAAGTIPGRRLPGTKSNYRFFDSDLPKIREVLVAMGVVEETAIKTEKGDPVEPARTEAA